MELINACKSLSYQNIPHNNKIFKSFRCYLYYTWDSTLSKCSCPSNWLMSDFSQCYYKSTTKATWDTAELDCVSKNAHLISINSQAEADYFNSIRVSVEATWVNVFLTRFMLRSNKILIILTKINI